MNITSRYLKRILLILFLGFLLFSKFSWAEGPKCQGWHHCQEDLSGAAQGNTGEKSEWIKVKKAIDGDTIVLKGGKKIRLIGVDTPEIHENEKLFKDVERTHIDMKTMELMGRLSAQITQKLIKGRSVRLEYGFERRDRYGRTLAYVFFKMREDGLAKIFGIPFNSAQPPVEKEYMLNRVLVQYGYAYAFTRYPFQYSEEFRSLEKAAVESQLGIWKDLH